MRKTFDAASIRGFVLVVVLEIGVEDEDEDDDEHAGKGRKGVLNTSVFSHKWLKFHHLWGENPIYTFSLPYSNL